MCRLDMMLREREAAEFAVESDCYGVWRSQRTGEDCGRVGAGTTHNMDYPPTRWP